VIGFYLLGRLTDLARQEIISLATRRGEGYRIVANRFVTVESADTSFYKRLAYTRVFGQWWFSVRRLEDVGRAARESGLQQYLLRNGPYAIRSNVSSVVPRLGWYLDGQINLRHPKTVVYVVRAAGRYHFLAPAHEIRARNFAPRNTKYRPFHHPTSLNAREARLLVNISGVLPGERFLDPFAGAGGILLEAAAVGAEAYGIDIVEDMVLGASINVSHYGYSATILRGDARRISWTGFDAIATDVPYGRSSRVLTRDLRSLYREAFESMHSVMKRRRFCVVVADRDVSPLLEGAGFFVDRVSNWYVHSKLTRRVHVCRT